MSRRSAALIDDADEIIEPLTVPVAIYNHVIKHLYDMGERWDLVCPELPFPPGPREACVDGTGSAPASRLLDYWESPQACRDAVLEDHTQHMRPAYEDALATANAAARTGRWNDRRGAQAYVGDNGVMVIVRRSGRPSRPAVKSAYRMKPLGVAPRKATARDYFRAAESKLRDKTTFGEGVHEDER